VLRIRALAGGDQDAGDLRVDEQRPSQIDLDVKLVVEEVCELALELPRRLPLVLADESDQGPGGLVLDAHFDRVHSG
jgi:hypothetical protein